MAEKSKTLVMKFGGTSVGNADAMSKAAQIVKDARAGMAACGGGHFRDFGCDQSYCSTAPCKPQKEIYKLDGSREIFASKSRENYRRPCARTQNTAQS